MIVSRAGMTFECAKPRWAPSERVRRIVAVWTHVFGCVEHMADTVGDQLPHGAPASRGFHLEAPVELIIKLNRGFHESKLASFMVCGNTDE